MTEADDVLGELVAVLRAEVNEMKRQQEAATVCLACKARPQLKPGQVRNAIEMARALTQLQVATRQEGEDVSDLADAELRSQALREALAALVQQTPVGTPGLDTAKAVLAMTGTPTGGVQ